jgi:hypothetical protein
MNAVRALPLAFLFGSIAFSQTSDRQFSSESFRANCPIEIKASLKGAGKIVPIVPAKNELSTDSEQQLWITLSNPKSEIVAVRITVYGFPVGGRVDPAVLYFPHNPAEITKTIAFDQTVAVGQAAKLDVAVPNFSTVTSIDLNSVTYSDGSSWRPEGRKSCRAVGLPIDAASDMLSR